MNLSRSARNRLLAGGLLLCGGFFLAAPLLIKRLYDGRNLTVSTSPLSGNAIMRGAYVNSGSRDVGPDPDWDFKRANAYGGRTNAFMPSEEDLRLARERLDAAAAARAK